MTFLVTLSEIELQQGHLSGAVRLAQRALEREALLDAEPVLGPHYVLGVVMTERNELSAAEAALEVAVRRAEELGAVCCRVLPALALALVRHVSGDRTSAWAAVHALALEHGDQPMVVPWVMEAQVTLSLWDGDLDGAGVAVDALDEPARSRLAARLHAARGDRAAALRALRRVPLVGRRDQLEHLLLRAHAASGEDERSRLVKDALAVGEPDDYLRTFGGEATWILPALRRLEAGWGSTYVARVLAAASTLDLRSPVVENAVGVGVLDLSPREQEVFGYLETRLSMREIGRELYISRNTVKTHIKSIYQKLGVQNRAEARLRRQAPGLPSNP